MWEWLPGSLSGPRMDLEEAGISKRAAIARVTPRYLSLSAVRCHLLVFHLRRYRRMSSER